MIKKVRYALLCTLCISFAFFVGSCSKNQGVPGRKSIDSNATKSKQFQTISSVILESSSFWILQEDGSVEVAEQKGVQGDIVQVVLKTGRPSSLDFDFSISNEKVPDRITAKRSDGKGSEQNYVHILVEGKSFYVNNWFVAIDCVLGMVALEPTASAYVYSAPVLFHPTAKKIAGLSTVAFKPAVNSPGFVQIQHYNPSTNSYIYGDFLEKSVVSNSFNDIEAAKLYQLSLTAKNPIQKKEFLQNALEQRSAFSAFLENELSKLDSSSSESKVIMLSPSKIFTVSTIDGSMLNIRSRPQVHGTTVVAQLNDGDSLTAVAYTENTSFIDGEDAVWYKVLSPVEGWVFGAYLLNENEEGE